MDNEIVNKSSSWKKLVVIAGVFIVTFLVYFMVMSLISPFNKLKELENEFGINANEKEILNDQMLKDSTYLKLLKDKAYLQSRVQMSQTDSIYLTINLQDSTSNIEINGVTVHSTRISSFIISKLLRKTDDYMISRMLSSPFTIASSAATIKREPVMLKVAPKDTSEYKPDIIPDTSIVEPVSYIFEMTNGTRIYVCQEEKERASDRRSSFRFDLKERLRNAWISLKSVAVFKVPEYHPFIKIKIPRDDGKIIYRALPKNGQIAVYT